MKKITSTIILLFIAIVLNGQKVLLLIDPTVSTLKNIKYLVENKCIDIPNLKFIGVYNTKRSYDFSESEKFIKNNNLNYIELKGENMNISDDSLFCNNVCSPIFNKLFKQSDGVIFFGGADIPPKLYQEKTNLQTDIIAYEKLYELSFLYHLIGSSQSKDYKPFLADRTDYVVLGICLGMQNMNVASGGSLYQDIPTDIYNIKTYEEVLELSVNDQHKNYWNHVSNKEDYSFCNFHTIKFLPNSFFLTKMSYTALNKPIVVSNHHQSVRRLGLNFKISATSNDGKVIEAMENTSYKNVIGVQFHPEVKFLYDGSYKAKMNGKDQKTTNDALGVDDINFNKALWHYISDAVIKQK